MKRTRGPIFGPGILQGFCLCHTQGTRLDRRTEHHEGGSKNCETNLSASVHERAAAVHVEAVLLAAKAVFPFSESLVNVSLILIHVFPS